MVRFYGAIKAGNGTHTVNLENGHTVTMKLNGYPKTLYRMEIPYGYPAFDFYVDGEYRDTFSQPEELDSSRPGNPLLAWPAILRELGLGSPKTMSQQTTPSPSTMTGP